jgi:hypothetical protein
VQRCPPQRPDAQHVVALAELAANLDPQVRGQIVGA